MAYKEQETSTKEELKEKHCFRVSIEFATVDANQDRDRNFFESSYYRKDNFSIKHSPENRF
jgi:hypothetical protein